MRNFWLVALVAVPMTLQGQRGSGSTCCSQVTAHVQAAQLTAHDGEAGAQRHERLRAIVLWRASGDLGRGTPSMGALDLQLKADSARAASGKLGRSYLGEVRANGIHYVEYDQQHLWALGQEFNLPHRDSALVLMIDGVDAPGGPRVAGHAYIAAEMPEKFWTKTWTSGDTTFFVHSGNTDAMLLEALRASPAVRAFIATAGSR